MSPPSRESDHAPVPLGQRLFDNMYLLLAAGLLVMVVLYTGWGLWEITSLPTSHASLRSADAHRHAHRARLPAGHLVETRARSEKVWVGIAFVLVHGAVRDDAALALEGRSESLRHPRPHRRPTPT